jgi:RNA polymerase sigma-70 factor (ECF subfamily)
MDSKKQIPSELISSEISKQIDSILSCKLPHLSPEDKEDIAQEVKIKIWSMLAKERKIINLRSYLWKAVYTTALDFIDKKTDKAALSEMAILDYTNPVLENGALPQDLAIEKREVQIQIAKAIDKLSPKKRLVLKVHLTGMNIREIAEFLNWRKARVNSLYYRARKDLKTILKRNLFSEKRSEQENKK